jgi:hypothetical protein
VVNFKKKIKQDNVFQSYLTRKPRKSLYEKVAVKMGYE